MVGMRLMRHDLVTSLVHLHVLLAACMDRHGRRFGRDALRARSRQREGGDGEGHDGDNGGPEAAHGAYQYVVATLKVK